MHAGLFRSQNQIWRTTSRLCFSFRATRNPPAPVKKCLHAERVGASARTPAVALPGLGQSSAAELFCGSGVQRQTVDTPPDVGTLVSREGESSGSGLKKGRGHPAALAWQAARHKRRSDAGAGSFPSNIWFRHHRLMLSGRVVRQHLSTSKTLLKNSIVLCRIKSME